MNNYPYRPQQQGYSMMSQPSQQIMTPMYPGPFQQRLAAFAEGFRRTANCTPEQKVRELISSGQMTQAQFNQLSQIANSLVRHR